MMVQNIGPGEFPGPEERVGQVSRVSQVRGAGYGVGPGGGGGLLLAKAPLRVCIQLVLQAGNDSMM
jgi:hypothetical protein